MLRLPQLLVLTALVAVASASRADGTDPLVLLRAAAETAHAAPSASVDLVITTHLVRDDKVDDLASAFAYRTAPGGRFEFTTVDPNAEEVAKPTFGYLVAGNGKVVVTANLARKRHMLAADTDGIAVFAGSRAAAGIGSGLGGLALSFLHPAAADGLAESLLSSEFVGKEEVDGETLLHARYTVQGDVPVDVWFSAGDQTLVRRIKPDVLDTAGVQDMARRHEEFDYQLVFDFNDWNTDAGLTAEDLPVTEPKSSLLMTSLYERPAPRPYSLLGQEAPAFTLPTAEGEEVDLAERFGEEVVLLEFWQTTCPICVKAMPALEELEAEYGEKGLGYYAVNVGEAPEEVAAFLESQELTPVALIDEEAEMATAYDVGPIPLILLVGRDGKVQSANAGFSAETPEKLAAQIEATLEGKDLTTEQLAKQRALEAERMAERQRLRALLDG